MIPPGLRPEWVSPKTWGLSADPWLALKPLHSRLRPSGHSPVPMPKCPAFSPYLPGIGYSVKTPNKTQSNNSNNKNLNKKELRSWTVRWDPGRGCSQLCGLGRVVHNLSPLLLLLAAPPCTFSWIVGSLFFPFLRLFSAVLA